MKKQNNSTSANLQFLQQVKKHVQKSTSLGSAPLCLVDPKYSKNKNSSKIVVFDNVTKEN